jgi:hypothetical protein
MKLQEAKSIVAKSIQAHTRLVRLMSEPTHDYETEALRRASLSHEDYREATEGRCGFPWEKDTPESDWNDTISRDAHFHIAQIAFGMVEALAGSWRDTSGSEFAEFLNECGLNSEWVSEYIPVDIPTAEWSPY